MKNRGNIIQNCLTTNTNLIIRYRIAHKNNSLKSLSIHHNTYLFPHLMWMNSNAMPSSRHTHPTTMYAIPKNGFFPPNNDVVLSIIRLDPLNKLTS